MSLCLSCGGGTASPFACTCEDGKVRIVQTTALETRVASLEAEVKELKAFDFNVQRLTERQAFERWLVRLNPFRKQGAFDMEHGEYIDWVLNEMFLAWQASARRKRR